MADLSHLSDSDLAQIAGQSSAPDLSHLSDSDLANIAKGPSWLDKSVMGYTPRGIIHGAANQLPTIGMVAGGLAATPADAAIGPYGTVLGAGGGYAAGAKARDFVNSLVDQDQSKPSGIGMGNSLLGTAKDVATGSVYDMGGKLIGAGVNAAANSKPGQYLIDKVAQGASKVGSAFTGIPQKVLETYASDPQGINQIAADADYSPQKMADGLREEINTHVQNTRQQLGKQLSDSFEARSGQTVDSQPIIDALNTSKAQINAKLRPEEVGQVDEMIAKVKSLADGSGQLQLKDASDLKSWLQEQAQGSYSKNGQIFQNGTMAQKAAKAGGAMARNVVNTAAPEVAQANDTLSQLHELEDTMNRNMLAEGKTGSSLYSAGSGENEANEMHLKELGDITGHDFLGAARKIAAAKQFGKAPIMPVDSTGKTVVRAGTAGLLGYALGGPSGAVAMEGLSSPLATKGIINASSMASKLGQGTLSTAPSLAGKGASILTGNDDNQSSIRGYADGGKVTDDPPKPPPTSPIDPNAAIDVQASMRKAFHFKNGGQIPGKPNNGDKKLAWVSNGEIILPNSITQHSNAAEMAKQFVKNIQKGKT